MSHFQNLILLLIILTTGCGNIKEGKITTEDSISFRSNIDLLSIQKKQDIELYLLKDTIKVKVRKNDKWELQDKELLIHKDILPQNSFQVHMQNSIPLVPQ